MIPPLDFAWDGEALKPSGPHWARQADKHYVVGERYRMAPYEERSVQTHNHFFACLHEAWQNLPEHLAERFRTVDHLRKYALIKGGFRDERSVVCASKAEAARIASFIEPMDDYAIVTARAAVVTVYTAKSQSRRAMGKDEFQKSKDAVLEIVSGLIGVAPETLKGQVDAPVTDADERPVEMRDAAGEPLTALDAG